MSIYERHDWIAKRVETAIDPDRPIVDPHHHLWDRHGSRYLAAELLADTRASHNVTHTVFVECAAAYFDEGPEELRPVGETNFVARNARAAREIGGTAIGAIVSYADLTLGRAVADVLVGHDQAGDGLFRGVRHGTNWSPHDDIKNGHHNPTEHLMADAAFRDGVTVLGEMGYSFDAWTYHAQLGELAEMAAAVPGTSMIMNHLGAPLGIGAWAGRRDEMRELWRAGVTAVAAQPNVVVKLGGIGMDHYYGMGWSDLDGPPSSEQVAEFWGDMVHELIDLFGPDRCMFESNFPVDRQTLPYTVLWNACQIMADRYTEAEQQSMFFDTAARVYRIDV